MKFLAWEICTHIPAHVLASNQREVTPVLAASESAIARRGTFSLVGKITAIDAASGTVTVNVLKGNKLVQPYLGQFIA